MTDLGKYARLAEWLRRRPRQPLEITFEQIEELIGEPLPRSSRTYPAHWRSNAGSRPGRAIREAGYRVQSLDLDGGALHLEPTGPPAPGAIRVVVLPPRVPAGQTVAANDRLGQSVADLLREYAELMRTLQTRGVLQTGNNPVSDYAEGLVARAFDLERTSGSAFGYDARDPISGRRYQVKARRYSSTYRNVGMGFIRGLDGDPFDELVAVVFAEDFSIHLAARMPVAVVREVAVWVPHVSAHQVRLTRAVLATPGVEDIAETLRSAAVTWT